MAKKKETPVVVQNEDRPLETLEFELIRAMEFSDTETIVDIIKERPDLIVFFCSVAIINKGTEALKLATEILPETLLNEKAIIRRMTNSRSVAGFTSIKKAEAPQIISGNQDDQIEEITEPEEAI